MNRKRGIRAEDMNKMIEEITAPFYLSEAYAKATKMDESSFEIMDAKTSGEIGSFFLNENGELLSFTLLDEPEPATRTLTRDEIATIAESFINIFYPGQEGYGFSAIS